MKKISSLGVVTSILLSSAMGTVSGARAADVEISYWMWDGNQAPVYQQCAAKFEAANPGIKIKISQEGWDNYWTKLTTGFVSGGAPDVFVNHISRFPEFLGNNVMVDLTPRIAADKVDLKGYLPGLADSWNKDGKQWGLPKDWDTIALVYNKDLLAKAGVSEDELKNADWNPENGGSFAKILAKLTTDVNGKHPGEAGFARGKVATFGLATDAKDAFGQAQWSWLAVSTGFKYIDKPWGSHYNYDSPALAKTFTWLRTAAKDGLTIGQAESGKLSAAALFAAGKGAIVPDGSWMISTYRDTSPYKFGFAPLPKGPEGRRSMFNGLADSIWTGSKHPDEAFKWVKYLGTSECQTIVGNAGVVFPARPEATAAAKAAHLAKGLDVSAFTLLATPETTFPFPITDHGSEINAALKAAVDKVMLGTDDPAKVFKAANDEVNLLF